MSIMLNMHSGRQTFEYDCGAKALQTVMAYYGIDIREDELIRELGTGKDGTRVDKMVSVAVNKGFSVQAKEYWSIKELKNRIHEGNPVIVLLQAWSDRYMTLKDWRNNYEDGHYAVVIGYSKGVLLFEDPASFHHTWLREYEFMARWHDIDLEHNRKYEQFGMVLLGMEPVERIPKHMD
ncbi:MAG TPA: cysteine peptidase family C39 domain-containing protein [Desulfobacteraceae bacterium]|nr:cysteine peptidase family C39 domain-containing protein [Desulfobacteraceae bacterium]HPJ66610.1 cysteine peptidase family C39 domain-containing protein [Desulfobacteraceae bacterium]HPQ27876.1 cysteine peptidase family C39 domain-containing protein [Desulfobacteraceae bacterium]